jgi:putative sigma-54 modulation protein
LPARPRGGCAGFPPVLNACRARLATRGDSSVQTTISARHGHLSSGTQEKITEKVEVFRKFFDRVTAISATVDLEHQERPLVELRVRAEHHDEFVAIDQADTIFAALDGAIDKMENQLRRFKERLKEHRAVSHKHLEPPAEGETPI